MAAPGLAELRPFFGAPAHNPVYDAEGSLQPVSDLYVGRNFYLPTVVHGLVAARPEW